MFPLQSPFSIFQARRGCLCAQRENWRSQAGLLTPALPGARPPAEEPSQRLAAESTSCSRPGVRLQL